MKKESIIELLKLNLIDINDEDKLKCLLDLSDKEENILINNIDYVFEYFSILYSLKKYDKKGNYNNIKNIDNIFKLKNKNILKKIYKLVSSEDLMNSSYYCEVIETFLNLDFNNLDVKYFNLLIDLIINKNVLSNEKCKDIILNIVTNGVKMPNGCFGVFSKIASNSELILNSNYANVISECLTITSEERMELIKSLVTSKNLLKSPYFNKVFTNAFNISDSNRLFTYVNTFINSNVLDSDYFDVIYDKFFKINEGNNFSYYQYIVTKKDLLNSPYMEQTIDAFIDLKNATVAESFYRAVTNNHLINSNYFLETLNIIKEYENVDMLKLFKRIACDNKILKHPDYLIIIKMAKSIEDYDILNKFKEAACNTDLMKSPYYIYTLKIFKTKKYSKYLEVYLKLISNANFIKSRKYKEAFDIITTIDDLELLNKIYYVAINSNALSTNYYIYTLYKLIDYSDSPIFDKIIRFSCTNLLFTNYYGFIFEKIKDISNPDYFKEFALLALNPALLKSSEYIYIINSTLEIDNPVILSQFNDIISSKIINYKKGFYVRPVVDILKKVKDQDIMNMFKKIIEDNHLLIRDDYLDILLQLSYIDDFKKFEIIADATLCLVNNNSIYFHRIFNELNKLDDPYILFFKARVLCNDMIIKLPYYKEILDSFDSFDNNLELIDRYSCLIINRNLYCSSYHKFIFDYAKNYDDPIKLSNLYKYATNEVLLSSSYYEEIINMIHEMTVIKELDYKFLLDQLDNVLGSNAVNIDNSLKNIIKEYNKYNNSGDAKPLINDEAYLIDLLPKAFASDKIEELFSQVKDGTDINSKTRIKKMKRGN